MLSLTSSALPVADVQSMKDAVDAAYRMAKKVNRIIKSLLRQLRPF